MNNMLALPLVSTLKSKSSESSLITTAVSVIVIWSSLEDDWSSIPAKAVISEVNATVPVPSGNVIVLSAVGSVTAIVVSKLSAVAPSNTNGLALLKIACVAVTVDEDVIAPLPTVPASVTFAPEKVAAVVVPDLIIKLPLVFVKLP